MRIFGKKYSTKLIEKLDRASVMFEGLYDDDALNAKVHGHKDLVFEALAEIIWLLDGINTKAVICVTLLAIIYMKISCFLYG